MIVKVLRWPSESKERDLFRELGVPRLLILEGADILPPDLADPLEDWVSPPVSSQDLRERTATLRALALACVPALGDDDILRFGGRMLALSPTEAAVMRVLIRRYHGLTPRADLVRNVWPKGPPTRNTVDLRVLRLRRRIAPLRLSLRTVVRKGYVLEWDGRDEAPVVRP